MIKFGPGGNSLSFYNEGYKSTLDAPKWLADKGLSIYEYECGQGVRISEETAKKFGEEAKKYNIEVSQKVISILIYKKNVTTIQGYDFDGNLLYNYNAFLVLLSSQ